MTGGLGPGGGGAGIINNAYTSFVPMEFHRVYDNTYETSPTPGE